MSQIVYEGDNSSYLQQNPTWHVEDSPWKANQILAMMRRNNLTPSSIFEIGCGAGEILRSLQHALSAEIQFTGWEIAKDAYHLSLERQGEMLSFRNEDLLTVNDRADLLLVIDVFEHVEDYIGFIRKCREKATYKIFHIPLDLSVLSIFIGTMTSARRKFGHLHYFNKETALATLSDAGYEVVDYTYTHGAIDLSRTFRMKLAKLPRILLYKLNKDFAVNLLGGRSLLVLAK